MFDYSKPIKGLCFVEDIVDSDGNKITAIIFDNQCRVIPNATRYLRYLRKSVTCSYNTLKAVSYQLCYLYDFLTVRGLEINRINYEVLSEFIYYLTIYKVKPETISKNDFNKNKFSIEKSLYTHIPLLSHYKSKKIVKIHATSSISPESIAGIVERCISFLSYLKAEGLYDGPLDVNELSNTKKRKNFLRANKIQYEAHKVNTVEDDKIFTKEELELIASNSSVGYERILYYLLESTGFRIGELLGIRIINCDPKNTRGIDGDIKFKDNKWIISTIARPDNPFYARNKSSRNRDIQLLSSQTPTFELMLERYLKWRDKVLKGKKCEWFFISSRGTHLSQDTAYKKLKRNIEKLLLSNRQNLSFHNYRHTFITKEAKSGLPSEYVSKLAGHKDPEFTRKVYVHYTNSDIASIRQKYDEGLER